VLTPAINGRSPGPADLKRLHGYWRRAIESHAFQYAEGSIQPVLLNSSADLDDIGNAIVIRAVDLARELCTRRLRLCAGPNCAWLFIDHQKQDAVAGVIWLPAAMTQKRSATISRRRNNVGPALADADAPLFAIKP